VKPGRALPAPEPRSTYMERCTVRPAFKRALDAQIRDFKDAA
jgi:hypothetical protein